MSRYWHWGRASGRRGRHAGPGPGLPLPEPARTHLLDAARDAANGEPVYIVFHGERIARLTGAPRRVGTVGAARPARSRPGAALVLFMALFGNTSGIGSSDPQDWAHRPGPSVAIRALGRHSRVVHAGHGLSSGLAAVLAAVTAERFRSSAICFSGRFSGRTYCKLRHDVRASLAAADRRRLPLAACC